MKYPPNSQLGVNANGCDHHETLNLTIGEDSPVQTVQVTSEGPWTDYDGNTIDTSGIYSYSYTNASGCDSTINVALTVNDIVNGVRASIENNYSCEIFNLGNNRCQGLMDMISHIEKGLEKEAKINFMDIQPGDVEKTFANIDYTKAKLNYNPKISIQEGIPKFIEWYKLYHKLSQKITEQFHNQIKYSEFQYITLIILNFVFVDDGSCQVVK